MRRVETVFALVIAVVILCGTVGRLDAQESAATAESAPQIAVLDVLSESFGPSELRLFTDILRTEIFKANRFQIVERGVIQRIVRQQEFESLAGADDSQLLELGQLVAADKLLITRLEQFSDTTALNIRLIDVETSILDFTENVFVVDQNDIFDALRDLAVQIDLHYDAGAQRDNPDAARQAQVQRWMRLGATREQAETLMAGEGTIDEYLSIRQYDVTFTVADYMDILEGGWNPTTIITFFREGVPFNQVEEALNYGIVDLDNYRVEFKPEGLSFREYLDAYDRHILTAEEYLEFRDGYNRNRFVFGAGGVANSLPIANADFRFFLATVGWEYFVTSYQRNVVKASTEAGFVLMNGVLPTPYVQVNAYTGVPPFYFKLAIGGAAEVFLGGHFAAFARAGIEITEGLEFNLLGAFFGTQPAISYTDLSTQQGEPGYVGIDFPYVAAFFVFKPTQLLPLRY